MCGKKRAKEEAQRQQQVNNSVIADLRKEIDELKNLVLTMQSKMENNPIQMSVNENNVNNDCVRNTVNNDCMRDNGDNECMEDGKDEIMEDKDNSDCMHDENVDDTLQEKEDCGSYVVTVTHLLDLMVEYLQNPKEQLKGTLLGSVRKFRGTIKKNG